MTFPFSLTAPFPFSSAEPCYGRRRVDAPRSEDMRKKPDIQDISPEHAPAATFPAREKSVADVTLRHDVTTGGDVIRRFSAVRLVCWNQLN